MIPEKVRKVLEKQHYKIVGDHSAVQICRWTKKSLRDEDVCYKEKFYGIESHRCCQMTPAVMWCPNKCLHCWRAIELTLGSELTGEINSPSEIIDGCIEAQRKLLTGFKVDKNSKKKQLSKANMKKWKEAQEPMQFAISLSGEPTVYEKIGDLIEELEKRGKTSFLVTNGLYPERLKELENKNQLPTQLYISVNSPNKKLYDAFHRSSKKDAWGKLNESLELLKTLKGKTRTVFRINLIKGINMSGEIIKQYAELIKKTYPLFVEVKGFMSVGFARERLGYDKMPDDKEMEEFVERLVEATGLKLLDSHKFSRAYVLGKDKKDLKIKF
jgi:tRNA wybutosine-synthesizing protein 1